jgi:hypothetical protein
MTLPNFGYLPFEEDLALSLNNLEFPLPNSDFYQVWLKLVSWFWRRFFFSIQTQMNVVFPIVAPPDPEDHDLKKLESTLYQKAFM